VVALQAPHLLGADEGDAELAVLDALRGEHPFREVARGLLLDLGTASIVQLDRDHPGHLRR
jgi:hypothetical protein